MKGICSALLGLILTAGMCFAGERSTSQFRTNSDIVLINATVLDRQNRPVRGLTRDQFRLFDEKAEESIAYFSEEEVPVSVAVLFDVSGSMQGKLADMRLALASVLQSANVQDEFSLITFADRPRVVVGWTRRPEEIQNDVLLSAAHGETSLLDALQITLNYLKKATNSRKAIVIFSDGGDNHSRFTEREAMRDVQEAGAELYALDSTDWLISPPHSPEEISGPDLLERLCDRAGGRYFQADGKRDWTVAAERISRELRSQYLIGYVPSTTGDDGRFHHVRLQLNQPSGAPKLYLFFRRGYRAPND